MRYYLIAGEASGDLHAGNLMKQILLQDPKAEFKFFGGDKMLEVGGDLKVHYRQMAFMGFVEVILHLREILKLLKTAKADVLQWKPDVLILVDYPGFNMRMAEMAHQNGIKVVYYISPQIWAWKQNRVFKLKKTVDRIMVILPFEKDFYAKFGMEVDFVGHPLLDAINNKAHWQALIPDAWKHNKPIVALLPGSRKQEVSKVLPVMLQAIKGLDQYHFVLAKAPGLDLSFYAPFLDSHAVEIAENLTYPLLSVAKAALVTSGTATLETALFGVPEVVCYKGGKLSYLIAKQLVKIPYISLVNLVVNKPLVKELIQDELNVRNLRANLLHILQPIQQAEFVQEYQALSEMLGGSGASARAASIVVEVARSGKRALA